MQYYIRIRDKAFGPFDVEQLMDMRSKGKLSRTSEISENKVDWQAASNFDFLFPAQPLGPAQQMASSGVSSASSPLAYDFKLPSEPADWFYSINGTEGFGPVTASAIKQMIQAGTLRAESLVWQQGQNAQLIRTVQTFAGNFSSASHTFPPPMPSSYQQQPQQSGYQPENTGLFCSACGSPVVQTAVMCPKCSSPINKRAKNNYNLNLFNNISGGYFDVLKKYVEFNGRARRKEYWNFTLINAILCIPIYVLAMKIADIAAGDENEVVLAIAGFLIILHGIFSLAIFLPSLAVLIRRLHDTGNSGWMWLVSFIPFIGGIILLVFLVQDSQPGNNQYGPNPKYIQ